MHHVEAYLTIPDEVAQALGGLVWTLDGEALRRADGSTFALTEEILTFLEGFSLQRPLVPLGYLLIAYGVLRGRHGPKPGENAGLDRFRQAFHDTGRSERNAGAFLAVLLDDLPLALEPPSVGEIWRRAIINASDPIRLATQQLTSPALLHRPPAVVRLIEQKLAAYSTEDLETWLRTGAGPIAQAGQNLADSLRDRSASSIEGLLGNLANRQRLAGALPLVEQLGAALTLPPRQLSNPELPLGGYSDLTNRGHPDQILLSQFALDELELLRRLAERELLYYRREEPRAEIREELVVVLDQGVRTWGAPRLVLLAATYVLARIAESRKQPLRLVTTGRGGATWDPAEITPMELVRRLEVADLTPHPGQALEGALQEPATQPRDVVLLTHPLALGEADVQAAARRVTTGTRLFALTTDREGLAGLGQFLHGQCIPVRSFRVDLTPTRPRPPGRSRTVGGHWHGAIEPNPHLLFINPGQGQYRTVRFAFDAGEQHLLLTLAGGAVMLVPLHGPAEMLPRAALGHSILTHVDWVQGIPGGFLVGGHDAQRQVLLARYDLKSGRVECRQFGDSPGKLFWSYLPQLECVAVHGLDRVFSLDLATGEQRQRLLTEPLNEAGWSRGAQALMVREGPHEDGPVSWVQIVRNREDRPHTGPWVTLEGTTGSLVLTEPNGDSFAFCPRDEGEPALLGGKLLHAQRSPSALVLGIELPATKRRYDGFYVLAYQLAQGRLLHQMQMRPDRDGLPQWHISPQGKYLAFLRTADQVEVRWLAAGDYRQFVTPHSRYETGMQIALGVGWLVLLGHRHWHLFSWVGEELAVHSNEQRHINSVAALLAQLQPTRLLSGQPGVKMDQPPAFLASEADRYVSIQRSKLIAALDRHGVVTVYNGRGTVLAQFCHRGSKAAAATPTGARFGHPALLGRPTTAEAARAIAQALRSAEQESPENAT